jgi:hypothetical protein
MVARESAAVGCSGTPTSLAFENSSICSIYPADVAAQTDAFRALLQLHPVPVKQIPLLLG